MTDPSDAMMQLDRLRAENAALRADAERYRVIRDWPNRDGLELAIVSSLKVEAKWT